MNKWDIHDSCCERVHKKLGEMIALDCQPYSIVEDKGFRGFVAALEHCYDIPRQKFVVEKVIPRIKVGIEGKLQSSLSNVHYSVSKLMHGPPVFQIIAC